MQSKSKSLHSPYDHLQKSSPHKILSCLSGSVVCSFLKKPSNPDCVVFISFRSLIPEKRTRGPVIQKYETVWAPFQAERKKPLGKKPHSDTLGLTHVLLSQTRYLKYQFLHADVSRKVRNKTEITAIRAQSIKQRIPSNELQSRWAKDTVYLTSLELGHALGCLSLMSVQGLLIALKGNEISY